MLGWGGNVGDKAIHRTYTEKCLQGDCRWVVALTQRHRTCLCNSYDIWFVCVFEVTHYTVFSKSERSHPVLHGQLFIIINAVDTKHHIKSVALSELVTFGYMFRPLPGHRQANKE
jgi:hypothetical protein